MKVVLTDKIYLTSSQRSNLLKMANAVIYDDVPSSEEEIIKRIKDADIVTANWININKKIINNSPKLKYVVVPAVGYEWVDIKTASERKIKVSNCPAHSGTTVAEFTIALLFAVTKRIVEANDDLQKQIWKPLYYTGTELNGKKIGIIGYGNIGRNVARLAQGLGMEIMYANSTSSDEELDNIIRNVDFLSLNLPLTDKTRNLIDKRRLNLLKSSAYIINTARGAIVDQKALMEMLKYNKIAGAALDVYDNEPLTGKPSHDIVELAMLKNVVATPHIAFNTQEASVRLGDELINNIKNYLEGKLTNLVN